MTSGPVSESGGMIALIRLPSGRRASTIAERLVDAAADLGDDLVEDPAQVRLVVEAHRASGISLPWRSTQMSYGPLTMISLTVSSASSRSSGPWPRMSSASSIVICVALGAREAALLRQVAADVGEDALAQRRRDPR